MLKLLTAVPVAIAVAYSWQVVGHHAFSAEFDKDAPINIEGKVSKLPLSKFEESWGKTNRWTFLIIPK